VAEQLLHRADVAPRIEQMGRERMALRQHRDPILGALTVADHNLAALEIDILNPEEHTLHQAHAGAIEEIRHQPIDHALIHKSVIPAGIAGIQVTWMY